MKTFRQMLERWFPPKKPERASPEPPVVRDFVPPEVYLQASVAITAVLGTGFFAGHARLLPWNVEGEEPLAFPCAEMCIRPVVEEAAGHKWIEFYHMERNLVIGEFL